MVTVSGRITNIGPPVSVYGTNVETANGTIVIPRTEKVELSRNTADGITKTTNAAILWVNIVETEI